MNPIADMLIRIKNASRAGQETVLIPYSKFKHELARVLERAGLVGGVERKGKRVRKTLELRLRYEDNEPLIHNVELVSKSSRRVYRSYKEIKLARGGIVILSTSKGVLTGEEAKKAKVGGELLAEIW